MPQSKQARPLEGITIVDLSRVLAGPFCTMILAQLGARIIKVEMPGSGDDSRAFGPFVNGKSLYFSALNYDKQSIALNLKNPDDRHTLEGLLEVADVVVENFRPGTMEKLGYGWDTLHERYPNLIYGAASGFGDTGPYSRRAAYDMVVQGMGGVMSMTGQPGPANPRRRFDRRHGRRSVPDDRYPRGDLQAFGGRRRGEGRRGHARLPGRDARGCAGHLSGDGRDRSTAGFARS